MSQNEAWQRAVDWALANKSWGLHTALTEGGPQSDIDYDQLIKDDKVEIERIWDDSDKFAMIYSKIRASSVYVKNIQYGLPRRGHAEGTVAAHIQELDANIELVLVPRIVPELYNLPLRSVFWKLKILVHVHDLFKIDAKKNSAIEDPQSHASLARAYLFHFTDDEDLLNIVQYHDVGYAVFRRLRNKKKLLAEDVVANERLMRSLNKIGDLDLYLLFCIIDSCTASKGREMITWFVEEVNKRFKTSVGVDMILPGEWNVGESW